MSTSARRYARCRRVIERHCAAPDSTDFRPRRFSTQKASQRNLDAVSPGHSRQLGWPARACHQPKLVIRVRFPSPAPSTPSAGPVSGGSFESPPKYPTCADRLKSADGRRWHPPPGRLALANTMHNPRGDDNGPDSSSRGSGGPFIHRQISCMSPLSPVPRRDGSRPRCRLHRNRSSGTGMEPAVQRNRALRRHW